MARCSDRPFGEIDSLPRGDESLRSYGWVHLSIRQPWAIIARTKRCLQIMRTEDYPIDRSIGFLLGRTFRRLRPIMEQQINSAGISYGMWFFLRALWERDGVSQREIAEMVGLTQPTAWAALRKLEAQKMVTLQPDSEDKRKVLVFLTEKGKGLEEVLLPKMEKINELALQGISKTDLETFRRVLRRIESNIGPSE